MLLLQMVLLKIVAFILLLRSRLKSFKRSWLPIIEEFIGLRHLAVPDLAVLNVAQAFKILILLVERFTCGRCHASLPL